MSSSDILFLFLKLSVDFTIFTIFLIFVLAFHFEFEPCECRDLTILWAVRVVLCCVIFLLCMHLCRPIFNFL